MIYKIIAIFIVSRTCIILYKSNTISPSRFALIPSHRHVFINYFWLILEVVELILVTQVSETLTALLNTVSEPKYSIKCRKLFECMKIFQRVKKGTDPRIYLASYLLIYPHFFFFHSFVHLFLSFLSYFFIYRHSQRLRI